MISSVIALHDSMLTKILLFWTRSGELVHAAKVSWASSLIRSLPEDTKVDIWYHTANLLERADDPKAIAFENVVLAVTYKADFLSERNQHINVRMKALSERDTEISFDTVMNDGMTAWSTAFMGVLGGTMTDEEAAGFLKTCVSKCLEAGEREDCPPGLRPNLVVWGPNAMTYFLFTMPQEGVFNLDDLHGEEQLVEVINEYQPSVHGRAGKERLQMDYMLHAAPW